MKGVYNFIVYNNTFTLILAFVFLGGGTVLAANEDVREAVVDTVIEENSTVTSVDNSYIRTVDLDSFEPIVQILSVSDDGEFYYVTYQLTTIDLEDAVWQPVTKEEELLIEVARVGDRDLGLYLAEEFAELTADQVRYLREVQVAEIEAGAQEKVVTREYSGLIGRFLDTEEETFAGYDPVIEEPEPVEQLALVSEAVSEDSPEPATKEEESESSLQSSSGGSSSSSEEETTPSEAVASSTPTAPEQATTTTETATSTPTEEPEPTASSTTPVNDTLAPTITLVGEQVVEIEVDGNYDELGAEATDETDGNLADAIVITGEVDTTTPGEYVITYSVADGAGNTAETQRTVNVVAPAEPEEVEDPPTETNATSSSAT